MANVLTETIKKDHDFWHPHIENCEKAGIPGKRYCRENNLVYSQFSYWQVKYKKQHSDFINVKVSKRNDSRCLCSLEFSKGQRLLIHDLECLRILPQILELIG